jgi:hypothetical protein
VISLIGCAVLAAAQNDEWYAINQQGSMVNLFTFNDLGVVTSKIGSIPLGAAEYAQADAFRCGFGFCLFETDDGSNSYVYNVSWIDASLYFKATLPGTIAHNLHLDAGTGDVWTIAQKPAQNSYIITHVVQGVATPFLDISSWVPAGGMIWPGASTQCSALQSMYVAIDSPQGTQDTLLYIDLTSGKVLYSQQLDFPIISALWANCSTGIVGGSVIFSDGVGRQTAVIGAIQDDGAFRPTMSDPLPNPPGNQQAYQLNGVLTASESYTYVVPLYPGGGNGNASSGLLWMPTPTSGSESFVQVKFFVLGAAVKW